MSGKSSYITPEGAAKIEAELEALWKVERPRVTQEVHDAAALGDRSENAEYIYGKKRLREIDRRVKFLRDRLEALTVVHPREVADASRIYFGAWVTLEDEAGETRRYRLIGPDETDMERGFISIESPMGRALMGKYDGDTVSVKRPAGLAEFSIVKVEYED